MEYPTLKVKQKSRQMLDNFLGYNHNLRIGENEFYDMQNMTSDDYPVLAPRGNRGVYKDEINASAIIAKDKLCYVAGTDFFVDGININDMKAGNEPLVLSEEKKQLVSIGSYVIILPDKKWVNTIPYDDGLYDFGDIDVFNKFNNGNEEEMQEIGVWLCSPTGKVYDRASYQAVEKDGEIWADYSVYPPVLKQYSGAQKVWVNIPAFLKISAVGIGQGLKKDDSVSLWFADKDFSHLNGYKVLQECTDDYLVVAGMPSENAMHDETKATVSALHVSRTIPDMDFVVECNNRLWGCRYGYDKQGAFLNEIYASKLGDFKNWNCFAGISTDSYAVSCGTDGPFTGAINYLGYPLFFKENCVHKVYGDYPANFRLQNTACRGVQMGSHNSLAIVNETLFYKSGSAVCAYDGSLPVEMSSALGEVHYSDAVACGHGNKYYIDMKDAGGDYHLFVYDTAKRMWHKEDNLQVDAFCSYGGEIYAIEHGENRIITLLGSGTKDTKPVEWIVETGIVGMSMPDMKYISRLLIRMALEKDASVKISIQYDSVGKWEPVCTMNSTSLRSFAVPIRPRRCDHFRIRIEGVGQGKIYSITKTIEQGSDVS